MSVWVRLAVGASLALAVSTAWAIPAFPGAEGAGANAAGGRVGDVYHVTSLADTNTVGTLRYGLNNVSPEGRTIVFDVGGVIWLTGDLRVQKDYVTIAGQTAPGDGIMLAGNGVGLANRHDIIFRHLAVRLGDLNQVDRDALGTSNVTDSIIDHCSVSWGVDETLSASNTDRLTIQWCIVSEGLEYSLHDEGSGVQSHSYGSLLRYGSGQLTLHHNLYAHNKGRNPRVGDNLDVEWANNVVFDGGYGYSGPASEGTPQINYVGNTIVRSDDGPSSAFSGGSGNTQIYQQGNVYDGNQNTVRDGTDTGWGMFSGSYTQMSSRFPFSETVVEPAETAYQRVLNEAGSSLHRDAVDLRIINDVLNMTGDIIDSQNEVGGYPTYAEVARPADFDTDGDGMPNDWEIAHGLDPNADDHKDDFDMDGYRNLEEYLNSLVPIPAPRAIVWTGGVDRYELITHWDIPWQPTLADRTEINSGQATVGYRFQEAGTLAVANAARGSAGLAVTAGGLSVANEVYLGSATGAQGTAHLTGGSLTAGGAIVLASAEASTGELTVGKDAYVQVGGLTVQEGDGRLGQVGVEIASDAHSLIHTTAASTLAGRMDVQVLGGFRPHEGDRFAVISSSDPSGEQFIGAFAEFSSNITLGLPPGSAAFAGSAESSEYELIFQGLTYGDVNADQTVDGGDLSLMGGAWSQGSQGWDGGDFSGEGEVGDDDLALMNPNWMWSLANGDAEDDIGPGEVVVPEPASIVLLALGAVAMIRTRTRAR